MVIDYCTLNKLTRKFTWPLPKVEDVFSKLNSAEYFSTLDLCAEYHHISLDEYSIPKTAFNSLFGKYEYIKVPFGLAQAPAYFQEHMTGIIKDFTFTIAYLDDIIIFSRTAEEHLTHIQQFLEKLQTAHLSMKLSKCHFYQRNTVPRTHSQHKLHSTTSIRNPAYQKYASTKTPKQVCTFLGLVGYYRKFIKNFAKIAKPLTLLTCPQATFDWTPTHHNAFLTLKESVTQAPILQYPDPNRRYIVYTNASDDACGAQSSQEHNRTEFPIAFLSHTFSDIKENGGTTGQEAFCSLLCSHHKELLSSRSRYDHNE